MVDVQFWERSRRLGFGMLVCLWMQREHDEEPLLVFATIARRDVKMLAHSTSRCGLVHTAVNINPCRMQPELASLHSQRLLSPARRAPCGRVRDCHSEHIVHCIVGMATYTMHWGLHIQRRLPQRRRSASMLPFNLSSSGHNHHSGRVCWQRASLHSDRIGTPGMQGKTVCDIAEQVVLDSPVGQPGGPSCQHGILQRQPQVQLLYTRSRIMSISMAHQSACHMHAVMLARSK